MVQRPLVLKTPQPPLGPGAHDGGILGGRLPAQILLPDGQRLDDRIGYRHAIVATEALADAADDITSTDGRLHIVTADTAPLRDWLQVQGATAVLLRPDRYVAGVANDVGALRDLLRRHRLSDALTVS
jgi:3-(3-hydroxy-phenyl)propionate hydroxylase